MPHKCDFCEKLSAEGFFSDVEGGTYWFCSFECEVAYQLHKYYRCGEEEAEKIE